MIILQQFAPSFLTLNVSEGSIILSHVLENSQHKKPPPGKFISPLISSCFIFHNSVLCLREMNLLEENERFTTVVPKSSASVKKF